MARLSYSCACGASQRFWLTRLLHRALCTYHNPRKHWVPPSDSAQAWLAGSQRCFRCRIHERSPEFRKPCRGHQLCQVELS